MMHIPSLKDVTKEKVIEALPDAPFYHLSLKVKEGYKPDLVVKEGDRVLKYQRLAKAGDALRVSVYSPVSGSVLKITDNSPDPGELPHTIYIKNDFREEETESFSPPISLTDKKELIRLIEEAGILGHGGAEFPAALKYKTKDKDVKTFIINGAECEPYLTADYAIMKQRTAELIQGIKLINRILEAEEIVIGIEEQNRDLVSHLNACREQDQNVSFRIVVVPDEYPQGGELQLIRSVTGDELPKGTIPLEAGVVMSNVGTIYSIYRTLTSNKPVISRILTVSGEYSGKCGNYEVKLGTPVKYILEQTGYQPGKPDRVLMGGPMMGKTVNDFSVSVSQGTNGILIFPELYLHRSPCIGCGYCVDVCPMDLMPFKYDHFYRIEDWYNMQEYDLKDCIDCASCEYICPCEVPLMKSITEGKKQLKKREDETRKACL